MIFAPMTPTLSLPSQDLQFLDMFEQICNQLEKDQPLHSSLQKTRPKPCIAWTRIQNSRKLPFLMDFVMLFLASYVQVWHQRSILKKTSRAWRDSAQCQNEMTHLRFGRVWWWMALLRPWGWVNDSNSVLYTCYRSCTKDLWNHHFKNISSPRSMNKHQESK